jgi:hypothetical protein
MPVEPTTPGSFEGISSNVKVYGAIWREAAGYSHERQQRDGVHSYRLSSWLVKPITT